MTPRQSNLVSEQSAKLADGADMSDDGSGGSQRRVGNYIGGAWIEGADGSVGLVMNPTDPTSAVCRHSMSSSADIAAAVAAATAAQPGWAALSPFRRASYLFGAARALEASTSRVAADLTREEGKTLREAEAEVRRAIGVLDFFGSAGFRLGGSLHPSEREGFWIEVRREPIGVVAAITPWNFPIAIPAWKLAPALISGNTVVLKPSSLTPLTAANLVAAFEEAKLPAGVVNLLLGSGSVLGPTLAEADNVDAITFTGSTQVGRHLHALASSRGKRVQAEMGGHNPVVVLADADLEEASRIVADGAFMSTGQKCTATRRVIIERPAYDEFLERLIARADALKIGDPTDPTTDLGPIVSADQLESVIAAVARAVSDGADVACGGHRVAPSGAPRGYFFAPTVLTNVHPQDWIAQTEVFGPVVSVMPASNFSEAVRIANGVEYGLSAGVCGRDINRIEAFVAASQSGVVTVNAPTAGMEFQVPVHGVKASGLGPPEQGDLALEFFTNIKTVYRHTFDAST